MAWGIHKAECGAKSVLLYSKEGNLILLCSLLFLTESLGPLQNSISISSHPHRLNFANTVPSSWEANLLKRRLTPSSAYCSPLHPHYSSHVLIISRQIQGLRRNGYDSIFIPVALGDTMDLPEIYVINSYVSTLHSLFIRNNEVTISRFSENACVTEELSLGHLSVLWTGRGVLPLSVQHISCGGRSYRRWIVCDIYERLSMGAKSVFICSRGRSY